VRAREEVCRALKSAAARMPDVFAPGTRVLVGFSGGQDSTCLLHALVHQRRKLDVVAAHIDHGLRAESASDAERVADLARAIGAHVEVQRVDLQTYRPRVPGWSIQQAARAARYQALAMIAQQRAAAAVLVAHTADDQAETLLMNLLRGAGLPGLAAMRLDETIAANRLGPPLNDRSANVQSLELRLARPLLSVSRAITAAYCADSGLAIVEDPSNASRAYTRNRVRLDLLPMLERFNPAIRAVLARTADLIAEDDAVLDDLVAALEGTLAQTRTGERIEYDLLAWRAEPRAVQRRLLRRGLESLLGDLVDVRASPIEDALDIVRSGSPSVTYHLPHGVELCIGSQALILRLHGKARPRKQAEYLGS
jgi:tRNA(Ile)-lysidine synthase